MRTNRYKDVLNRWLTRVAVALPLAGMVAVTPSAVTGGGTGIGSGGWAGNIWLGGASTAPSVTLANVRTIIGADTGSAATLTGAGVGVALIDTGVAPVPGLPAAQVVNGPDLSFESQSAALRYLDTYGHGTHMAGIIVGNDTATGTKGIAPRAKLTSVKVGTSNGAVDVSQMIAAIDWVVAHRNDDPANPIRVINLSYGTGGTPDFWTDPVQFAVEQAWKAGIVVVAAVGNTGGQMSDPATDQFILNVGSASTRGTLSATDDTISTFTSLTYSGGANRRTDVLAPGEAIVSLRDPNSNIDTTYPAARVGTTLFRGSGTSQATAITSAAIALLLQARPTLTPDQVKNLVKYNGTVLTAGNAAGAGYHELNVNRALAAATPTNATQTYTWSSGTGKLEAARGGTHVSDNGTLLSGEKSIFGPFDSATWALEVGSTHLVERRPVDGIPVRRRRLDRHLVGVQDLGVGNLVRQAVGHLDLVDRPELVRPLLVRPLLVRRHLGGPLLVQRRLGISLLGQRIRPTVQGPHRRRTAVWATCAVRGHSTADSPERVTHDAEVGKRLGRAVTIRDGRVGAKGTRRAGLRRGRRRRNRAAPTGGPGQLSTRHAVRRAADGRHREHWSPADRNGHPTRRTHHARRNRPCPIRAPARTGVDEIPHVLLQLDPERLRDAQTGLPGQPEVVSLKLTGDHGPAGRPIHDPVRKALGTNLTNVIIESGCPGP